MLSCVLTCVVDAVVPRDEPMGKYIADRDVVRICTQDELEPLLEKFARRDQTIDAELISPSIKSNTSIGAALYVQILASTSCSY